MIEAARVDEPSAIGLALVVCRTDPVGRAGEPAGDGDGPETAPASAEVPPPSDRHGDWDEIVELSAGSVAPDGGWRASTSPYLVFAPATSRIADDAPTALRELLFHNPAVEFAYADSASFRPGDPDELLRAHHRPGFSPDRLRAQMYLGEVFLVSRAVAEAVDPEGTELRAPLALADANVLTGRCASVAHVPRVLYHVPVPTLEVVADERPAGTGEPSHLQATGFPAVAAGRQGPGDVIDLTPDLGQLGQPPLVSIVIPTNGSQREIDRRPTVLCLQAIDSIVERTTYPHYEVVVVVTPGAPPDLAAQVMSTIDSHPERVQPAVRFCRDDRPFNFSNACNRGAIAAEGELLVFLNDDTVVATESWLERLVMYGTRPDIGAVGARLIEGDDRIQHAGIWTRGGHPAHRYAGFASDHPGYLDCLSVPQNCLAVTGACLAVTADKFQAVGGFCPEFPSSYNDVDLCLKLGDAGYRTVVDPATVLIHFEASSRDPHIDDWELALLHRRWRSVIIDDPYDNPHHLAPESEEWPPPDPMVTEARCRAGLVDFLPRIWPGPSLIGDRR